jgi:hypothetical protein
MAWKITDFLTGAQPIADTSTTQKHDICMEIDAIDDTYLYGRFIYLKGLASTAQGSWVTFDRQTGVTALLAANAINPVAVAMSACLANQFGWYQIVGTVPGLVLTGYVDNALVYATSTAGSVDDAVVAGDRVKLAKGASAIGTPVAGQALFEIDRPFMDDGSAA